METGGVDDHYEILDGDGGWMVIDPNEAGHLFASYYNFGIFRYRNGKPTLSRRLRRKWSRIQFGCASLRWDANDPRTLFTGTRACGGRATTATWKPVSSILDGSAISAVEIAPKDSARIYIGTENGNIFRSTDRGKTWSANLSSTDLPGHTITRLTTQPDNAEVVYATLANTGHSHAFSAPATAVCTGKT
ncbi:MAG: hypothetical protein U0Y68_08815 [Blastocatellia bacterium]